MLEPHVDKSMPTLFVAECVLVYLQPDRCFQLLQTFVENFQLASTLIYEQCNISSGNGEHDFGVVMLRQLTSVGINLLGADACKSLENQCNRLKTAGFANCHAIDIYTLYCQHLNTNGERERIERLEMLDEGHLLKQLLSHYCIAIGQPAGSPNVDYNESFQKPI